MFSSRKAQFFILSALSIVTILYFVSRWMEPSTVPDASTAALMDEPFIFNNIKEKTVATADLSRNCDELKSNLEEFKQFARNYALEKNYVLDLDYSYPTCTSPMNIDFSMSLTSVRATLKSNFQVTWTQK